MLSSNPAISYEHLCWGTRQPAYFIDPYGQGPDIVIHCKNWAMVGPESAHSLQIITNTNIQQIIHLYIIHTQQNEQHRDKTNKVTVRSAKTQINLGIRPVWSVFALRMKKVWVLGYPLSAQRRSDQTGWMPRLIWVFAWRTVTSLILSWGGSYSCAHFSANIHVEI